MSRPVAGAVIDRTWGSVTRKAVALVLADHASIDETGEWVTLVGQERIAREAEVSERTVRGVLAEFEAEGLITRTARMRRDGRGRTSDRTVLHREAILDLPEAVAGKTPTTNRKLTSTNRQMVHDQPEADARPTGKSFAGDPPEEPPVEPSASSVDDDVDVGDIGALIDQLPEVAWARRWCQIRGVPQTRSVLRTWVPAVREFLVAGGTPSIALLEAAHAAGIEHPGGWGFIAAGLTDAEAVRRANEWMAAK